MYLSQPEGFKVKGSEDKVYKLNKALYGLRKALRAWNEKINKVLERLSFVKCSKEPSLYRKRSKEHLVVVTVYVDDLLVTGTKLELIEEFKKEISDIFEMSDLGLLTYYLGIEVHQHGITLTQERYAHTILNETGMDRCNATHTPMEFGLKMSKTLDEQRIDEREYM